MYHIPFHHDNGESQGEAVKKSRDEPWKVLHAGDHFFFYGTSREVKAEILKRLQDVAFNE